MSQPVFTSNMQVIEHVFAPLTGRAILDIGCGRGRLLRALARRGARATGLDPTLELVRQARETAPDAEIVESGAEAMPFVDACFDGAVILNALHHIPRNLMKAALSEGLRVVRPGGVLLVIEPLARGGYQEAMAPIDDETEVRAAALNELGEFVASGAAGESLRVEYDTRVKETGIGSILAYARDIDESRAERIATVEQDVRARFARHAVPIEGGFTLDQPMIAVALRH